MRGRKTGRGSRLMLMMLIGPALLPRGASAQYRAKDTEWPTLRRGSGGDAISSAGPDQRLELQRAGNRVAHSRPITSAIGRSTSWRERR